VAEPLVTIAIPMYNSAATIVETLHSCFAQTHANVEVLLVDNNCRDDSVAMASRAAAEAGREVRVIACREQGLGPARNAAGAAMRGEYVAWVDHDDLIHPDKLRWQLEALQPLGARPAIASGDVVSARLRPGERRGAFGLLTVLPSSDPLLEALQRPWGVPPIGYLSTRAAVELLAETGGFLTMVPEDREYFARARLLGVSFVHVPRVVGLYRRWSESQMTNASARLFWAPDLAAGHRGLRDLAASAGVALTGAQRSALERSWGYWRWRPSRFDRQGRLLVEGPAGERALALTAVQRAVALATRPYPVATVEMLAVATCDATPSLYPAFGRVLEGLAGLIVAGAFEALDEGEARRALGGQALG
jgi:Glycosyl transferase family 2